MTTGKVGLQGNAPKVAVTNIEKAKYEKLWKKFPQYRKVSPGERIVEYFFERVNPPKGSSIIDFGCGTGRGGLELYESGMNVVMTDFVAGCLDKKVKKAIQKSKKGNGENTIKFVEADLNSRSKELSIYGYCCDVMEHIPEEQVNVVICNITEASQNCFFMIHTKEDSCGAMIGETLHVNQQPYKYWAAKFIENDCEIVWSHQVGHAVFFYVTAWHKDAIYPWAEIINTGVDQLIDNIKENAKKDFPSIMPHERQETEVMVLGGGPSLNDFKDEIIQQRAEGMKLITTNGSYNWAIRNGMKPSAQMVLDARPFNKKFLQPIVDDCVYFLASSCHPSLFDGLPKDRTYLWHVALSEEILPVIREHFGKEHDEWWATPGGSTVMLRAICLLPFIGYYKMHIYGMDSCMIGDKHHSYAQPENEHKNIISMAVKATDVEGIPARMFQCQPWMASQAQEFKDMIPMLGDHVLLDVKGDGLIAHMLKTGAQLPH